ncbi:MAG TPA: MBOAT family protein [Geminicoccaceae bacterium]|nr:MBOAT family protein [Geminicoccus sp.]HMU48634.1 MBOAT family protein [Geminicoccaceae bacterium]
MLFNSPVFILGFLPITLLLFVALRRTGERGPMLLLLVASLVFYGWWDWRFLPLLLASICANHLLAGRILSAAGMAASRRWLAIGIVANLAVLGWFKYAMFVAGVLGDLAGRPLGVGTVLLPIGISFFTFKQIAYLVDVHRGLVVERDPARYGLFVTFFPDLLAGPLVHHRELTPQLAVLGSRPFLPDLAVGASIFVIGLAKKLLVADTLALTATPLFDEAAAGAGLGLVAGWAAATAYALQIYFDFSGYSDMAIGIARMFGVVLPLNFASPYKAASIVEFWRRWHISLSRFLRDYLYVPLGGNRKGPARRYLNVFVTMLLGGIWHGAGWTFVLWGALHGAMIAVGQAWSRRPGHRPMPRAAGVALTLSAVIVAWVPFRAADLATTWSIWASMIGRHGLGAEPLAGAGLAGILCGLAVALAAPNTQTLFRGHRPGLVSPGYASGIEDSPGPAPAWSFGLGHALLVGALFGLCLVKLNDVSEFIYFQF